MAGQTSAQITGSNLTTSAVNHATGLKVKADGDPIGTIKAWPSSQAPDTEEWLECDGSMFDTTKYPELYAALGSGKLPDYKGQFLRGGDRTNVGKRYEDSIRTHEVVVPSHSHEFTLDISGTVQTASIQKNVKVLSSSSTASSTSGTGDTDDAFFYYKGTGNTCVGMTGVQVAKRAVMSNYTVPFISGGGDNNINKEYCWPGSKYAGLGAVNESKNGASSFKLYSDSTCSDVIVEEHQQFYVLYEPQSGFVGVGRLDPGAYVNSYYCGPFFATTNVGSLNMLDDNDKIFYYKRTGGMCTGMSVEETAKRAVMSNYTVPFISGGGDNNINKEYCWPGSKYAGLGAVNESKNGASSFKLYSDSTCSDVIVEEHQQFYVLYEPQSGFVGVGRLDPGGYVNSYYCGPFYVTGTYKTMAGVNEISIPVVKADTSSLNNGKVTGTIGESGQLIGTYSGASETAPKHTIVRYFIKAL